MAPKHFLKLHFRFVFKHLIAQNVGSNKLNTNYSEKFRKLQSFIEINNAKTYTMTKKT